jgi:uncharacterized membrane protein YqgA involved in biofilm formation
MKEIVVILLLFSGLALLFYVGALMGHLLGLDKTIEQIQNQRRTKKSDSNQQEGKRMR